MLTFYSIFQTSNLIHQTLQTGCVPILSSDEAKSNAVTRATYPGQQKETRASGKNQMAKLYNDVK